MILPAILVGLLVTASGQPSTPTKFELATRSAGNGDYVAAASLFAEAAGSDSNPEHREEAVIRLANIEWRAFRDDAAARKRLERLATPRAHLELARMATDLGDFATARAEARVALDRATKKRDRHTAITAFATAVTRDPRSTAPELTQTIGTMRALIAEEGPRLEPARILARAALRAHDGAAALEGIDAYYHVSTFAAPPQAIASAYAVVSRLLPAWNGSDAQRPQIAQALAGIRFFDEAVIVSPGGDIGAYTAMLHRIEALTNEYYRKTALGEEQDRVLRDGVANEIGERKDELAKRFGLYFTIGRTGSHVDLHMGHVVLDVALPVEQYGYRASKRFIALDSMVSNGFSEWANDGTSGDGGWGTASAIYQVRPRYADKPLRNWESVTDPEARAEEDRKLAEATARDREKAQDNPIQFFEGVARRLRREYLDGVLGGLRARGVAREALRDAFMARLESDVYTSSIVLHEGRHAIDIASGTKYEVWELEYRAKLSEIALAPAPREALASVLDNDIGGNSTHGRANGRLARDLSLWIGEHRAAIAGYDPTLPPLPQCDKLTDDQIRTAVASLDPLRR